MTVVIPAYNEEAYIGGILEDLSLQFYTDGMTVIVADGGSSDRTLEVVEACRDKYKSCLRIVVVKGGSVTRGRNAGLAQVKTPTVLFIDADVRLTNPFQVYTVWYELGSSRLIGPRLRSSSGFRSGFAYWLFNQVNGIISLWRPFAVGSFFGTHVKDIRERGCWDERLIHGEDWVLSGKYSAKDFQFCKHAILVDDRRFKKSGYLGMLWLMLVSAWKGESYMRKDHGYWS